jgi:hypothetical protein
MGSGAIKYIPNFIKTCSGIQRAIGGGDSQAHRQNCELINLLLLYFFKIMKVG